MWEKKCKESKDKLIINLSDYFVLHKILETANSENQYFSRRPRLKVDFFFFECPKGYFFQDSCIWKVRGFTGWFIKQGREIYHCGLRKDLKGIFHTSKRQDNFLYVKGVSFVILTKCDSKGVLFVSKLVYKRARGCTSGRILSSPPPSPNPPASPVWNFIQFPWSISPSWRPLKLCVEFSIL